MKLHVFFCILLICFIKLQQPHPFLIKSKYLEWLKKIKALQSRTKGIKKTEKHISKVANIRNVGQALILGQKIKIEYCQ